MTHVPRRVRSRRCGGVRAQRAIGLKKRDGEKLAMDQEMFRSFDINGDGKVRAHALQATARYERPRAAGDRALRKPGGKRTRAHVGRSAGRGCGRRRRAVISSAAGGALRERVVGGGRMSASSSPTPPMPL